MIVKRLLFAFVVLCITDFSPADEIRLDFRTDKVDKKLFRVNGDAKGITQSGEGLAIAPAQTDKLSMTGYDFFPHIVGDFELIISFEIKNLEKSTSSRGAGFRIDFESADSKLGGGIARFVNKDARFYVRCVESKVDEKNKGKRTYSFRSATAPASFKVFTYKVTREGDKVSYYWSNLPVAEAKFRRVHQVTFNKEPIDNLKFRVQHGAGKELVSVLLKTLSITATNIVSPVTMASTFDGKTIEGDPIELKDGAITFQAKSDPSIPVLDLTEIRFPRSIQNQLTAAANEVVARMDAGDEIKGSPVKLSDTALSMKLNAKTTVEIPILKIKHLIWGSLDEGGLKKLSDIGSSDLEHDTVLVRRPDKSLTQVTGTVLGIEDAKLEFEYEGENRTIGTDRLAAIVFAAHPSDDQLDGPWQRIRLTNGGTIRGTITSLVDKTLSLKTLWLDNLTLPLTMIGTISFQDGRLVYLSDRNPVRIEETPYFGRLMSFRRDESLEGKKLTVKGHSFEKGIAVHSRSRLGFDLNGEFLTFRAKVGFDNSVRPLGDAQCRILADGKPVFDKRIRATDTPIDVEVSIEAAKSLVLEVDFGENEDTGDRVIWGDAVILRSLP